MQKQKLFNKLKVIGAVGFFVLAFAYTGAMDAEYQERPSVCREWQGSVVCYKP